MPASGRGGAGNIEYARQTPPQHQMQASTTTQDIEAQRDYVAEKYIEQREEASYAHMGRGGAGNFYKPADLSTKGTFVAANSGGSLGTSGTEQHGGAFQGRGGAGNLRDAGGGGLLKDGNEDGELGRPESLEEAEKLPRPQSAYLGPKPKAKSKELTDLPV